MAYIKWQYLGENAIEISDISSDIHFQLGLRDYLKEFPELGIASFMLTDKDLTLFSEAPPWVFPGMRPTVHFPVVCSFSSRSLTGL